MANLGNTPDSTTLLGTLNEDAVPNIGFTGSTSGTITVQAAAVAGTNTLTLPAATDTLVGKATTDTLTNKTLTAPVLGAATATSINGVAITAAAGATLTATAGQTYTFPSTTATLARTDAANTFTGTQTLTGLLVESSAAGLTALTGGQGGALALTKEVNQFSTVAAGFGASLPLAVAGLTVFIINNGANALQVYGAGTDTVDGVATATGVAQMIGSNVLYTCTASAPGGTWVSEGLATGYSGSLQTFSFANALSANSGAVQAGATPITTMIARFTTVGGAGYSSLLPTSAPGSEITVINSGANSMNVFPAGSDAINALGASTAYSLPINSVMTLSCTVAGLWNAVSAPTTVTGTGASVLATAPTLTNPVTVGPAPTAVGSTLSVTAALAGQTLLLNTAGGSVATLPAATGTGNKYKFVVSTTATSAAHKILAASVSDFINGIAMGFNAGTAKVFASAAATNHSIQMPFAGTQPSGGFIGDYFEFHDIGTNLWQCNSMYQAGTTPTTPFSSATT